MPLNLVDAQSAPLLVNTVLAGDAIGPLAKQVVVIPVFVAFLALLWFAVRARHGRLRWLDKLAVVALLMVALLTKPDRAQHVTALRAAASWGDPALIHGDYLLVSATTGDTTVAIGVFGRVFVFQRPQNLRR